MLFRTIAAVSLAVFAAQPSLAQQTNYAASAINNPAPGALNTYGAQGSVVDDAKVAGGKALRVQTTKGANPWDQGVISSVTQPVHAGDPLVLAFWARLVSGDSGATSVTLPASVGIAGPPYTHILDGSATLGPEWKLFEFSGRADKDYPSAGLNAAIQVATGKQTIDFGPMYVAKGGNGATLTQAAPPPDTSESPWAGLDPSTIASKIINEPGAPEINGARASLVDDSNVEGGKALRVVVPNKGANPWDSTVASPIKKAIAKGDRLVLHFSAKLEKGDKGATTTTLPYNAIQLSAAPYTGVINGPADIGPDWKVFNITGRAAADYAANSVHVTIQLATAKQTVDFGPIVVLDLGQ